MRDNSRQAGTRNREVTNASFNIFSFRGGASVPAGSLAQLRLQLPPESFNALRSLTRSKGVFFSGAFFSVYSAIPINRSITFNKNGAKDLSADFFVSSRTGMRKQQAPDISVRAFVFYGCGQLGHIPGKTKKSGICL